MTDGPFEEIEEHIEELVSPNVVPVSIQEDNRPKTIKTADANTASFQTYTLVGNEPAFLLLPRDDRRHKATVWITTANGGTVLLGTNGQLANNVGGVFANGSQLPYSAMQEVWCKPQGQATVITVVDERY